MKQRLLVLACLTLFLFKPDTSHATKAAGGELVYEWISDSTYRFLFRFYRDCSDTTYPTTMPLCLYNPCTNTSMTITMNKFPGLPVDTSFPNQCNIKSKCDSPASTLLGFKARWYSAIATLPARCNSWRFFTYYYNRVASNNLVNSGAIPLYVEARLNNIAAQGNSSPYFSNKPSISYCLNTATSYNYGAIDPNADALVIEVINPLTGDSSIGCTDGGAYASFAAASPAISIPSNPFQTNSTFTINSSTGAMNFTPSQGGSSILTIRVKEYRNSVFIGSIMRDIMVNIPGGTTDVSNAAKASSAYIYPNPNTGAFTVSGLNREEYRLEVSNAVGQVVYSATAVPADGAVQLHTQLNSGLYQLKLTDKSNNTQTRRFVVSE